MKTVIMIAQVLMTLKMMAAVVMRWIRRMLTWWSLHSFAFCWVKIVQLCLYSGKNGKWSVCLQSMFCKECLQNVFAPVLHKSLARMKPESHRTVFSPGPKLRLGQTRAEKNRENAVYGHLHWPLLFVMTIQVLVMKIHWNESKEIVAKRWNEKLTWQTGLDLTVTGMAWLLGLR